MEPSYVILDCEGLGYTPQISALLESLSSLSSGFRSNSYDSDKMMQHTKAVLIRRETHYHSLYS